MNINMRPIENLTGNFIVCYISFRTNNLPPFSRIPLQSYILSNDASRPMFNTANSYGQHAQIVSRKLSHLYSILQFTYPNHNNINYHRIDTMHRNKTLLSLDLHDLLSCHVSTLTVRCYGNTKFRKTSILLLIGFGLTPASVYCTRQTHLFLHFLSPGSDSYKGTSSRLQARDSLQRPRDSTVFA